MVNKDFVVVIPNNQFNIHKYGDDWATYVYKTKDNHLAVCSHVTKFFNLCKKLASAKNPQTLFSPQQALKLFNEIDMSHYDVLINILDINHVPTLGQAVKLANTSFCVKGKKQIQREMDYIEQNENAGKSPEQIKIEQLEDLLD